MNISVGMARQRSLQATHCEDACKRDVGEFVDGITHTVKQVRHMLMRGLAALDRIPEFALAIRFEQRTGRLALSGDGGAEQTTVGVLDHLHIMLFIYSDILALLEHPNALLIGLAHISRNGYPVVRQGADRDTPARVTDRDGGRHQVRDNADDFHRFCRVRSGEGCSGSGGRDTEDDGRLPPTGR